MSSEWRRWGAAGRITRGDPVIRDGLVTPERRPDGSGSARSRMSQALAAYDRFRTQYPTVYPGVVRHRDEEFQIIQVGYSAEHTSQNTARQDPLGPGDVLVTPGLWICQGMVAARINGSQAESAGILHQNVLTHLERDISYIERKAEEVLRFLSALGKVPSRPRVLVSFYLENEKPILELLARRVSNDERARDMSMVFISRPEGPLSTLIATREGVALRRTYSNDLQEDAILSWPDILALLKGERTVFIDRNDIQVHIVIRPQVFPQGAPRSHLLSSGA